MNKSCIGCAATLALIVFLPLAVAAGELEVSHTDPVWNGGNGDVPEKGICEYRGGDGMSPSIEVSAIPPGTVKLTLHFTDEDWDEGEGAHGVVGYKVPSGTSSVVVPSFKGETSDLPDEIEEIESHRCFVCGGGTYLGPCSGGRGHTYVVYVYARDADGKKLAEGELTLGDY